MPDVVKHAWTHRPRAQGGTDPIEIPGSDLIWAVAESFGDNWVDVSNTYTMTWDRLWSNDASAFEAADVTGSSFEWIQLNTPGYYIMKCHLRGQSDFATPSNGFIQPLFELGGSAAALRSDIAFNLGDAGFVGNLASAEGRVEMSDADSEEAFYAELAFNWNPDDPQSLPDNENPLKVGLSWSQAGAAGTIFFNGQISLVRIAAPGFIDLSPA